MLYRDTAEQEESDHLGQAHLERGLQDWYPCVVLPLKLQSLNFIGELFDQTLNSKPMAHASADQSVLLPVTVQINGNGSSDVDDNPLTYF